VQVHMLRAVKETRGAWHPARTRGRPRQQRCLRHIWPRAHEGGVGRASARARCTAISDRWSPSRCGRVVATQRGDARSDLSRARSARTSRALASERAKTVCRGGLLHPDLQERAETTTASSDCRPRPTAPDPVASRGNSQSLICARQHVKHGFGTHNVPKPGITGARGDSQVSGKEWFICMLRLGEGRPPTQRSPTSAARSYL